jgi:choline dehydrogenase-like flavoprotein
MNLNATADHTFDAIVVGSGISGGWAAKELTQKGLRVLLLERGRPVEHVTDYPTAQLDPWQMPHRGRDPLSDQAAYRIQNRNYRVDETNKHFFVNELENPYVQTKNEDFVWARGHQVGGRSLTWGRQCYRWSDLDFGANLRDGHGVDWPLRYKDVAPWYSYVERFVGISGSRENLPHLPDSEFLAPMPMNCVEKHLSAEVLKKYPVGSPEHRRVIIGRVANLTEAKDGRGICQFRNKCEQGCPYGGYFSSNSATLPVAMATGRLTLRPHSIVTEVLYDPARNRAKGVAVLDAETGKTYNFFAKVIFINASTISSTVLLLRSTSARFPNGMGNDSGVLGQHLVTHHKLTVSGKHEGFNDQYTFGRRANGIYVPRFRNMTGNTLNFQRGYNYQGGAGRPRNRPDETANGDTFGAAYKEALTEPAPFWNVQLTAFGEQLPDPQNRVGLSKTVTDKWGLAAPEITWSWQDNDYAMATDAMQQGAAMLETAGCTGIRAEPVSNLRSTVHEMGTARMGLDPKTSVLNANNQLHAVPNVFVTDGACMTSASSVNPSLTYMALTARAAAFAVQQLKQRAL